MSCASVPELVGLVSQPEILEIIECPVCKQVPFPPIYQCNTGHNICKTCRPKLQECPLCQNGFSEARNYSVEQMVLASTHNCPYRGDGCEIVETGELLCDHIKICEYRSFKCPGQGLGGLGYTDECSEMVSIKSVREHLSGKHVVCRNTWTYWSYEQTTTPDYAWAPTLIDQFGKAFFCQTYVRRNVFYWTVFCIATAEEARKFTVKITFSGHKDNQSPRIQWRIPVQPIVKSEELRGRGNEMKGILIASCTLNDFVKVAFRNSDRSYYEFYTNYEISKLE